MTVDPRCRLVVRRSAGLYDQTVVIFPVRPQLRAGYLDNYSRRLDKGAFCPLHEA